LKKKFNAGSGIGTDLEIGAKLIRQAAENADAHGMKVLTRFADLLENTKDNANAVLIATNQELTNLVNQFAKHEFAVRYEKELSVVVDREKALFSTWYEIFPRSWGAGGKHGTLRDCIGLLPAIADMNFDVLYLAPIYPIGETKRRGKNNTPAPVDDDPGSPWAIGNESGGHKSINPELGSMEDFEALVMEAKNYGIEIAMDIAYQCSPDHPYIKEHPEWFKWRPDGTIQHAENPPKKYEDIVPINFETDDWQNLWEELRSIVVFWIEKGVSIFRVDNPHTKPFAFWQWLITEIKKEYPEVIFLSEAFTRPKVMYRLAKIGFSHSYTYFTWRNSKTELTEYMTELTQTQVRDYLRPNFWPNTPDILPEFLQMDHRQAFIIRLVLAATLSSNYGMYGPAFELCVNQAVAGKEEYSDSEKYEIKKWDLKSPGNIRELVTIINRLRKNNKALQETANIRFVNVENDYLLAYLKYTKDLSNVLLVIVNLDPFNTQAGMLDMPLDKIDVRSDESYMMFDMISDDKFFWHGWRNYVQLDPHVLPAHVFRVHRKLKRESDFDYFM
jgi:starch synthase (maltosyl-transferring)